MLADVQERRADRWGPMHRGNETNWILQSWICDALFGRHSAKEGQSWPLGQDVSIVQVFTLFFTLEGSRGDPSPSQKKKKPTRVNWRAQKLDLGSDMKKEDEGKETNLEQLS